MPDTSEMPEYARRVLTLAEGGLGAGKLVLTTGDTACPDRLRAMLLLPPLTTRP